MRIFATRVWGFDPETWPVITFGLEGNRDNLLKNSVAGDRIIFVGTQTDPTHDSDKGRILGMAEIGRISVATLKIVKAEDISRSYSQWRQNGAAGVA